MNDDPSLADLVSQHRDEIDPSRIDSLWKRITLSRRQPARPAWSLLARVAAVLVLALAVAGPVWALRNTTTKPLRLASGAEVPDVLRSGAEPVVVQLSDGSSIELGPESELRVLFNELSRVEILHRSGELELNVDETGRLWRIDAGLAAMDVMHASVRVEREREVRVRVDRGQVLVRSVLLEDGVELLRESQALELPTGVRSDWGTPMTQHDAPQTAGVVHVPSSIPSRALLLQAERHRRAGERSEAAELLHAIVERDDAESPIASFNLGRLHQAQRPELAAHDYALAIQLGLDEPLRRAAHRRWIESLEASGADTREAENVMLQAYPDEPLLRLDENEGRAR